MLALLVQDGILTKALKANVGQFYRTLKKQWEQIKVGWSAFITFTIRRIKQFLKTTSCIMDQTFSTIKALGKQN